MTEKEYRTELEKRIKNDNVEDVKKLCEQNEIPYYRKNIVLKKYTLPNLHLKKLLS
jgi:hypothetical protein